MPSEAVAKGVVEPVQAWECAADHFRAAAAAGRLATFDDRLCARRLLQDLG